MKCQINLWNQECVKEMRVIWDIYVDTYIVQWSSVAFVFSNIYLLINDHLDFRTRNYDGAKQIVWILVWHIT